MGFQSTRVKIFGLMGSNDLVTGLLKHWLNVKAQ